MLKNAEIRSLSTPAGVEARLRLRSDGQGIYFMINHTTKEQRVNLPWPAFEHLRGEQVGPELILAPYGVGVVTRNG